MFITPMVNPGFIANNVLPAGSPEGESPVKPSSDAIDNAALISDYFNTLTATVGAENEANRAFNAQQAEITRNFNSAEARAAREWSSSEAELNRQFNASEAQNTRDWQEKMSNTAYQRAMDDMKKAGLNPLLMASQGFSSSTPSGSTASGSSAQGFSASGQNASYNVGGGDTLSDFINSLGNAAKGLGSILSSISDFLPSFVIRK